jgi:hypothetical protein
MEQQIKSETVANMECFIYLVIGEVCCNETDVARQLEQGESFAEHNKTVFDVAMAVAKFYEEQLDLRMDAYERERKALEDVKKLDLEKQRLKKELFNVKKQLYCSDLNQKKEHSKFLDALNKYHCELNRRKKLEAKIKELEADLEEGGFNDERNFI